MADELIMGIDAGTSRVRVLVFEMDGTVVAAREFRTEGGSAKSRVGFNRI